jgi:hypothetical protein
MDYKFSIVIFLDFTSEFLTPVTPLRGFEKNCFKIYFLKQASNVKSSTLITTIAISKFKNLILKGKTIFPIYGFWGPDQVLYPHSHRDYSLEALESVFYK